MKYARILLACAGEVWALQHEKLAALVEFLTLKAVGGHLTDDEIEARIGGTNGRPQPESPGGAIAILPVYGVLSQRMNMMTEISGGTSMQLIAADVRMALADPAVTAIILDLDSPGGTVHGCTELADEIYASRGVKPIIAQVNSLAASAAYWIASQCDEIVVTPSGEAGSIGVYTIHEDISKQLDQQGVKPTILRAGKNKLADHPFAPLSEEAAAAIQKRLDLSYAMFVTGVARGRRVSRATVLDRFGEGRMFGAGELVARGMADRVATLPQTLQRFGIDVHPIASAHSAARQFREMRGSLGNLRQLLKVR